jgi:hypothetical protein
MVEYKLLCRRHPNHHTPDVPARHWPAALAWSPADITVAVLPVLLVLVLVLVLFLLLVILLLLLAFLLVMAKLTPLLRRVAICLVLVRALHVLHKPEQVKAP